MNTHRVGPRLNGFPSWLLSCLLPVVVSSASCGTHPNLIIHQTDSLSVVLHELPAGYPSLGPHSHPYVPPPKEVWIIIESLDYREGTFSPFSWGPPRKVFTRNQAEMLAPELSKALSLALPHEVVRFSVADKDSPDRHTKGLSFVLGDELHLIIEELRQPSYQGEQKTYQQQTHRWELLPGNRQRLFTSRPGGKGTATNWIMTPLTQEMKSR